MDGADKNHAQRLPRQKAKETVKEMQMAKAEATDTEESATVLDDLEDK